MNDLISRSDLVKEIKDLIYSDENQSVILTLKGQEIFNSGVECALFEVMNAPAIDAVPLVHARWIDLRESHKDIPKIECSNCKTMIIGLASNFCPKCGARMDGEAE